MRRLGPVDCVYKFSLANATRLERHASWHPRSPSERPPGFPESFLRPLWGLLRVLIPVSAAPMQLGRLSRPPEPSDLVRVLNQAGGEWLIVSQLRSFAPYPDERPDLQPMIHLCYSTRKWPNWSLPDQFDLVAHQEVFYFKLPWGLESALAGIHRMTPGSRECADPAQESRKRRALPPN